MSDGENESGPTIRALLRAVRDESNTAFDLLPNGMAIGKFAHDHATARHRQKVISKRQQARRKRLRAQEARRQTDEPGSPKRTRSG